MTIFPFWNIKNQAAVFIRAPATLSVANEP
jgi:hypothetical protein